MAALAMSRARRSSITPTPRTQQSAGHREDGDPGSGARAVVLATNVPRMSTLAVWVVVTVAPTVTAAFAERS